MDEEQLNNLLSRWGNIFVQELQNALGNTFPYAPGFRLDAYSNGRNSAYSGTGNKIASGELFRSIEAVVNGTDLELYMLNYWRYVNDGVAPKPQYLEGKGKGGGQSAFIQSLLPWIQRRMGISGPQALGAALAIRRNIWKFGIAPSNFYTIAVDNMITKLEAEFGDQYFDILEQIIVNRTIRDITI